MARGRPIIVNGKAYPRRIVVDGHQTQVDYDANMRVIGSAPFPKRRREESEEEDSSSSSSSSDPNFEPPRQTKAVRAKPAQGVPAPPKRRPVPVSVGKRNRDSMLEGVEQGSPLWHTLVANELWLAPLYGAEKGAREKLLDNILFERKQERVLCDETRDTVNDVAELWRAFSIQREEDTNLCVFAMCIVGELVAHDSAVEGLNPKVTRAIHTIRDESDRVLQVHRPSLYQFLKGFSGADGQVLREIVSNSHKLKRVAHGEYDYYGPFVAKRKEGVRPKRNLTLGDVTGFKDFAEDFESTKELVVRANVNMGQKRRYDRKKHPGPARPETEEELANDYLSD